MAYFEQNKKTERKGTIVGRPTIIDGQTVVTAEQDRLYQLADKRNKIKHFINYNVVDYKTYTQALNSISMFAREDVSKLDVLELSDLLKAKGNEVLEGFEAKRTELNEIIEDLKTDHYTESAEALTQLNVQVEHRVLELVSKFTGSEDGDKRRVGSFIHNADRVQALALLKVSILPQYAGLFNNSQKAQLLEKSKSDAQIKYEQAIKNTMEKKGKELGEIYREVFMMHQVMKKVTTFM